MANSARQHVTPSPLERLSQNFGGVTDAARLGGARLVASKSTGEHDGKNANHGGRADCRVGSSNVGADIDKGATVFKNAVSVTNRAGRRT